MFSINKVATAKANNEHNLVNLQGQEVHIAKGETVKLLKVSAIDDNVYWGIQKKIKGLVVLPTRMFNNFSEFREGL